MTGSAERRATTWWHALTNAVALAASVFVPGRQSRDGLRRVLYQIDQATMGLAGFIALMALLNLVVIRIFVVAAAAYGLAPFALDAIVRVLVLELLPLLSALYVAVGYSVPRAGVLHALAPAAAANPRLAARWRSQFGAQLAAGVFAVLLFAALSGLVSLVLAYLAIYGGSGAGIASYNRAIGRIFTPSVTLVFGLKVLLFALCAALIPAVNVARHARLALERLHLRSLVQMFVAMLLIEILSLLGNY